MATKFSPQVSPLIAFDAIAKVAVEQLRFGGQAGFGCDDEEGVAEVDFLLEMSNRGRNR